MVHAWFGGPGEPRPGKEHEFAARVFLRHPDMRIVGLYRENAKSYVRTINQPPLEPAGSRTEGINMKSNNVAKTMVLTPRRSTDKPFRRVITNCAGKAQGRTWK
jgi:hypothetical protein